MVIGLRGRSIRKLFFFPRILSGSEKRFLALLALIAMISGFAFLQRMYYRFTEPIPRAGSSYSDGMLEEPQMINPLYATRDADRAIAKLLYAGLLSYRGDGSIESDLAQRYEISEDGKTYTVTLKDNVAWHDGAPLTADDVLFTIHAIQNPQYRSPLRPNWQGVSVEKLNDKTVRFVLRTPYSPFIENLTLGILPLHIWEHINPEQAPLSETNLKPVGSGPYAFRDVRKNKDGSLVWYRVSRNQQYHREGPYIKIITFFFFNTEDELIAAWRRGTIEGFGGVTPRRLAEINSDSSLLLSLSMPRIFGLFFNEKKASPLADKAVREAIAHALDRKHIAQNQQTSHSTIADSPLPWLGSGEGIRHPYDPEKAKNLLENAGWKDTDNDGIRERKIREKRVSIRQPLRLTITTSDWPDLLHTAEMIASMLKQIGIDVTIEKKSFPELESSVIRPRNFQLLLFGQVYGYEPDPFAFWHSSQVKDPGLNITFYANKRADALLEQARHITQPAQRGAMYREFSDIIVRDLPALFLFSQHYVVLLPSDMQGAHPVKISLPSDRFNEIAKWYRKTKRVFHSSVQK